MSIEAPQPTKPRRRWLRWLSIAAGVVVVLGTFLVVLPSFVDYSAVWAQLTSLSLAWVVVLTFVTILNVATYGINWMVVVPGLRYRQSLELAMASTAVTNLVPAGGAVGMGTSVAMLKGWGFTGETVTRGMVLTGVWNQLVNVGYPVVAVALLFLVEGERSRPLETASLIGLLVFAGIVVVFVMIMSSSSLAVRIGGLWDRVATRVLGWFRRGPVEGTGPRLSAFRIGSVDLLRRRWLALTLAEIGGAFTVFLTLLACLRATGVTSTQVSVVEVLAAWSLVRLLTAIPITPGGLGFVEVGLTAALVGFGGDNASVVAGVLLYRVLTFVPPVALGAIASFTWRLHHPNVAIEPEPAPTFGRLEEQGPKL